MENKKEGILKQFWNKLKNFWNKLKNFWSNLGIDVVDYKFTDKEIEMAAGIPIEITAAQCEKCNTWVKPVRKN